MARKPAEKSKPYASEKPKFRAKSDSMITLSVLCAELKHDPKLARAKLRAAVKDAKQFPELAKSHTARRAPWKNAPSASRGIAPSLG